MLMRAQTVAKKLEVAGRSREKIKESLEPLGKFG